MISTKALLRVVGQPTPTSKTLVSSRLNASSRSISRNYPRYNFSSKRLFCDKKVAETSPKNPNVINPGGKVHDPTPPPPPPGSGGNGMWLLLVAALAGGGYYFREEISQQLGGKKTETSSTQQPQPVEPKPKPIETIKLEIKEAEEKLKKVEAAAQASKPLPAVAVPQAEKPKVQEVKGEAKKSIEVNWEDVRKDIVSILDDETYDDGSYGPVFVRLAWHHAGTYDKNTKKGGTEGAAMRFSPELKWGANAGLDIAQARLEPIKKKYPDVTYSDLWSFAGTVALEEMGLPKVNWRPGRKDCKEGENVLPDGLLPDADGRQHKEKPQQHVREIFNRMGFNDQEIVALLGAHAIGRCHTDRSGFWGPWTNAPTTFSNEYFRLLLEETWSKKKTHKGKEWKGPEQYEDKTGELMMLPTDLCLVWDPKFKKYVEIYAKDEERFFKDFTKAWLKLQENNVRKFHGWRRYIFFGPRE